MGCGTPIVGSREANPRWTVRYRARVGSDAGRYATQIGTNFPVLLLVATPRADSLVLTIRVHLKRAGMEMRMLVDGTASAAEPDPTLIKLILRAQHLRDRMLAERLGVSELAATEGVTASYITRIIRMGFLAPDIVTAILNGRQPVGLTANKLANDSRLPNGWAEQRQALGFG